MNQQWKTSLKNHWQKFRGRVHKNVKGQVAIFVALVFQIIFILFALMINVGLLVHHKINLQQSTDLAAYYGAMKQAEILNVVAHVNFQIRQAYKLMAWRYRVLGTFGMQPQSPDDLIRFPIKHNHPGYAYDSSSQNPSCTFPNPTPYSVSPTEIPFMCVNHYGFKDYLKTTRPEDETFCKSNCERYSGGEIRITIPTPIDDGGAGGHDIPITTSINDAIRKAGEELKDKCEGTGPLNAILLAKFYASYLKEVKNRMLFIKMMMANLSTGETESIDLEGKKIIDGVKNTLVNNLTEANNASLEKDRNIFETYNSISAARQTGCGYPNVELNRSESGTSNLFAEINFKFLQYFILRCIPNSSGNAIGFKAQTIYMANGELESDLERQIIATFGSTEGPQIARNIKDIMTTNYYDHTIGIEKNPWCSIYYGVKASTTPVIPFLPISKITLFASSFAQPFGGSVGPRQYKSWPESAQRSDPSAGRTAQTDYNLPIQNPVPGQTLPLSENARVLLNYSNYVGDTQGLADARIVGIYHDMLLNRNVTTSSPNHSVSGQKTIEPVHSASAPPSVWPAYSEWNYIADELNSSNYDPLALMTVAGPGSTPNTYKNSYMRDIELSVVAPNQFEMTYYSIEPDFYNVYLKDKLEKPEVLNKFKERAGINSSVYIPYDFGYNRQLAQQNAIPQNFSVRNQLELVQHVMRNAAQNNPPAYTEYAFNGQPRSAGIEATSKMYFTYIPFLPGSLLTSWTMKDLVSDDFAVIPKADETKTPFATCLDEDLHGNNGYGSVADMDNPQGGSEKLPPAPGNCITGGRTGYSVKIVSPEGLKTETVGDSTGNILNPPTDFLVF